MTKMTKSIVRAVPQRFHAVERQDLFHHLNVCWLRKKKSLSESISPQTPANLAPPLNLSINQHFPFPFRHLHASPGDGDDFGAL